MGVLQYVLLADSEAVPCADSNPTLGNVPMTQDRSKYCGLQLKEDGRAALDVVQWLNFDPAATI